MEFSWGKLLPLLRTDFIGGIALVSDADTAEARIIASVQEVDLGYVINLTSKGLRRKSRTEMWSAYSFEDKSIIVSPFSPGQKMPDGMIVTSPKTFMGAVTFIPKAHAEHQKLLRILAS